MNRLIIALSIITLLLATSIYAQVEKKEHHHAEEMHELVLNDGEKWKVNEEMMPHVRKMESDLKAFSAEKQKDYKAIAEKLQANINLLITSCTMDGKSHDELHKWLHPLIGYVKELQETDDESEAKKYMDKINHSMIVFNKYFE